MSEVWLVWMNDGLLGVFATREAAEARAELARARVDRPGAWETRGPTDRGQRWWQPNGGIARLEVERRDVDPPGYLEAERDGAVLACSSLRREVKGLNRALRDSQARVRLLEAVDRDPAGLAARVELDVLRAEVRQLHGMVRDRDAALRALENRLSDADARARGVPDRFAVEIDRLLDVAFDAASHQEAVEVLASALALVGERRAGSPWPHPPGEDEEGP